MFPTKYLLTALSLMIITISMSYDQNSHDILFYQTEIENNQFTGNIVRYIFHSRTLKNKRDIYIWTPLEYDKSKKYPILFIHDGQNVFQSGNSYSEEEWHLDETVTELIANNEIEPMIMVGVANTKDRYDEYDPHLRGVDYGKALIRELIPELDKRYSFDKNRICTMGASYGGLISLFLGWEFNETFSAAACLSPAFNHRGYNYIGRLKKKKPPVNLKLVVVNGTEDLDSDLQSGVDEFISYVGEKNFRNKDLLYWIDIGQSHTELAWANQSKRIIKWLYKN